MLERLINFDIAHNQSFFLWGPRQCGKSTLLSECFKGNLNVNLLQSENFAKYSRAPETLRQELAGHFPQSRIVIDEIQKVPALLDEVHWLIENKKLNFVMCGSSARKLRRGHANLLGGRALRFELCGFVSAELNDMFDLTRMLNVGYLPPHYLSEIADELIRSYVADYLKEEIAAEGLVRSLPAFARFLDLAALSDSEIVSYSTFGRDVGVSPNTIQEYYQILVDTLIGSFLQPFTRKVKRRITKSPKFYFHDVGVVNHLAKRKALEPGSADFGKAFENWVFHELRAYSLYSRKFFELSYWRPSRNTEVDFVLNAAEVAIEAKSSDRVTSDHMKGLKSFVADFPETQRKIIVCRETQRRSLDSGIEVMPYRHFVESLWAGLII
jgi:uncharacterized protein